MRRGRVLVIDDEALVRRSIERVLHEGHEVVACAGVREALATLAAGQSFDVVLCDLMMPELTGMDLHAALAEGHPAYVERLVFMTGGACSPEGQALLERSSVPRVEKPFKAAELRRLVAERVV